MAYVHKASESLASGPPWGLSAPYGPADQPLVYPQNDTGLDAIQAWEQSGGSVQCPNHLHGFTICLRGTPSEHPLVDLSEFVGAAGEGLEDLRAPSGELRPPDFGLLYGAFETYIPFATTTACLPLDGDGGGGCNELPINTGTRDVPRVWGTPVRVFDDDVHAWIAFDEGDFGAVDGEPDKTSEQAGWFPPNDQVFTSATPNVWDQFLWRWEDLTVAPGATQFFEWEWAFRADPIGHLVRQTFHLTLIPYYLAEPLELVPGFVAAGPPQRGVLRARRPSRA